MDCHGNVVYAHDNSGFYIGKESGYGGPMPHNCVSVKPEDQEGCIPRWNGEVWLQVENHMGRTGYVNGERVMITEYGPLPEGWSDEYIDPRSTAEVRKDEILFQLHEIDMKKIRPLSALVLGSNDKDRDALSEMESESVKLRTELASLS